ncbi:hypothetical protein PVAND_013019 [Polypedilum vanderplanki]|uniref:Uncharacterized protein n=1 Tax=Polypedilum vanderplanki TaxID=319348 RepID=A0A9J6CN77_POLVA|nr:hypothetical protein PVAND_013019 [Polypedilum vanderplanki]
MTINLVNNSIINLPAFDLTGSSLTSMSLMLQLYDNQYNSISPKFLSNIFTGRTTVSINVTLYTTGPTSNFTCISNTTSYSIYNFNWPTADASLGPCYANWKDSYQTNLSCV